MPCRPSFRDGRLFGIIGGMALEAIIESREFRSLIEDYRGMCFWNLPEDFMPTNRQQVILALENLEHYGDMAAYRRAGEIRRWL